MKAISYVIASEKYKFLLNDLELETTLFEETLILNRCMKVKVPKNSEVTFDSRSLITILEKRFKIAFKFNMQFTVGNYISCRIERIYSKDSKGKIEWRDYFNAETTDANRIFEDNIIFVVTFISKVASYEINIPAHTASLFLYDD